MELNASVAALSALAHESRLGIFRALVQRGPQGLKPGELAEACGLPDSTLSFHLAHLLRAGLVSRRRAGRTLIYSARFDTVNGLIAYLMENCCGKGAGEGASVECAPGGARADAPSDVPRRQKARRFKG